jgi:hypothetical protein
MATDLATTGATRRLLRGDLVEHAAVVEVSRLRLRPPAEHLVDREQLDRGERAGCGRRRIARPVVVLRTDALDLGVNRNCR